ncbi:MAG: AzlC family ABC transporter permease [Erysipelotrichaceae bacterium]|nr:AzlC family ABC transporter permease [Erysipelotrichaceae bacterium]
MTIKQLKYSLKLVFPYTLPVLTGFFILGITYGLLMQTKGYGVLWAVLMSAVAFCGSMQFVAMTLLTTAFDPLQAFLLSFMVNTRHLFYGIAMLKKYQGLGKLKYFLIYTLCDETFSIVSSVKIPETMDAKTFYFLTSLLDYLYWVLGTFLGSLLGPFITFNTEGLDFVLTALFVVLFMEQMKKKENRVFGLIGISASVCCLYLFGSASFIIPALILILLSLMIKGGTQCS